MVNPKKIDSINAEVSKGKTIRNGCLIDNSGSDFQLINMNTFLTANFVDFFQAKDLVDVVSEAAKKKNKLLEKFIAVMMKVAPYLFFSFAFIFCPLPFPMFDLILILLFQFIFKTSFCLCFFGVTDPQHH